VPASRCSVLRVPGMLGFDARTLPKENGNAQIQRSRRANEPRDEGGPAIFRAGTLSLFDQ